MTLRKRWLAGFGGGAAILGVAAWLAWPSAPKHQDPPRARQYASFTACLLTDGRGVGSGVASAAWAGMQDAAASTLAKTQYLQVVGADTVDNSVPYANTLIQRHCDMILAAGAVQDKALMKVAAANPGLHFVAVGTGAMAPPPKDSPRPTAVKPARNPQAANVVDVPLGEAKDISAVVKDLVTNAFHGTFSVS